MGDWFREALAEMIESDGVVCRYCGRTDMLQPDPGAYYNDAINKQGRREPYLCHCAASYKARDEPQPKSWSRVELRANS